jgi:hypothetical protein
VHSGGANTISVCPHSIGVLPQILLWGSWWTICICMSHLQPHFVASRLGHVLSSHSQQPAHLQLFRGACLLPCTATSYQWSVCATVPSFITGHHRLTHLAPCWLSAVQLWEVAPGLLHCIDQWGNAYNVMVWLLPSKSPETFIAKHLWMFTVNIAKQVSIEWQIVIAKLGSMEGLLSSHVTSDELANDVAQQHGSDSLTWTFVKPYEGSAKCHTSENRTLSRTSSSSSNNNVMVDSS